MIIGRVFSGTHPIPPLMGCSGSILINEFEIFLKNPGWIRIFPRPIPITYKINLILFLFYYF